MIREGEPHELRGRRRPPAGRFMPSPGDIEDARKNHMTIMDASPEGLWEVGPDGKPTQVFSGQDWVKGKKCLGPTKPELRSIQEELERRGLSYQPLSYEQLTEIFGGELVARWRKTVAQARAAQAAQPSTPGLN